MAYTNIFGRDELHEFNRSFADRLAYLPMPTELILRRLRPENSALLPGAVQELLVEPSNSYSGRYGNPPPGLAEAMSVLVESVVGVPPAGGAPGATTSSPPAAT